MKLEKMIALAEQQAILSGEGTDCTLPNNGKNRATNVGFVSVRRTKTTEFEATLYSPVLCIVLQGAKETSAGTHSMSVTAGEMLLASHAIPIQTRITKATPSKPYLAVFLPIDVNIIRNFHGDIGKLAVETEKVSPLNVEIASPKIIDAISRLLLLKPGSLEAQMLAPLIQRELHFHALVGESGSMLRRLASTTSNASKISDATNYIRDNFRNRLSLPILSHSVGMSPSSFHAHFKAVTGTTPLQYQKDLRLMEGRRLLTQQGSTVTVVALSVGYESPNQFSREYVRKFGIPPSYDT